MSSPAQTREELVQRLLRNGVDRPRQLLTTIDDDELFGVDAAITKWEGMSGVTKGLLVSWLRDHEFPETAAQHVPPRLLSAIRGACRSPDGYDREMARGTFAAIARRKGRPVDELISMAMGSDWQITVPVNPSCLGRPDLYASWVLQSADWREWATSDDAKQRQRQWYARRQQELAAARQAVSA